MPIASPMLTEREVMRAPAGAAPGHLAVQPYFSDFLTVENALFRQVGPMVGSFDAGFGTWYLEQTVGRKRAKEIWYFNRKYTAQQALEIGLVNEVVSLMFNRQDPG